MPVLISNTQPPKMRRRRRQHKQVENLMTRTPNIKLSGGEAFGDSEGVDCGADNIEDALENKVE